LNIWDDYPAPLYNKEFYESCDALLGISKQTVNINKLVLGDKAKNKVIEYVPHGVDHKNFRPLSEEEKNRLRKALKETAENDITNIEITAEQQRLDKKLRLLELNGQALLRGTASFYDNRRSLINLITNFNELQ
jgi:hypothetical protein